MCLIGYRTKLQPHEYVYYRITSVATHDRILPILAIVLLPFHMQSSGRFLTLLKGK